MMEIAMFKAQDSASNETVFYKNTVSPKLETPTDIKPESVEKIAHALNLLIADAFTLYIKTKNFHWHISGSHFRDYHLMLDEQASEIFATIDPLAERVRKLGGVTIRSIFEISHLTSLKEENAEFVAPLDMLRELMNDSKSVAAKMRRTHKICDDAEDVATASLLEVYIDETERRTWFLFEASRN
jgi:starvation-inducible DNA-binding protein